MKFQANMQTDLSYKLLIVPPLPLSLRPRSVHCLQFVTEESSRFWTTSREEGEENQKRTSLKLKGTQYVHQRGFRRCLLVFHQSAGIID